jgi:hypothetical protein
MEDAEIEEVRAVLARDGLVTIPNAIAPAFAEEASDRLLRIKQARDCKYRDVPSYAAESEIRVPFADDPFFLRFLAIPVVVRLVDCLISPHATLRFFNGEFYRGNAPDLKFNQHDWHMNNPRMVKAGTHYSLDFYFHFSNRDPIETPVLYVPGSHWLEETPSVNELDRAAVTLTMPRLSLTVFESSLWHRQTAFVSDIDELAVVMQFTRPFAKPHFDHCRILGEEMVAALPERTQKFLGYYTRVPTSLDEFYVPPHERRYRSGQD